MRRREFITLLASAAVTVPIAALAQQRSDLVRLIGALMNSAEGDPEALARLAAFTDGLQHWAGSTVAICG
jgi:hypothetical protein